MSTPNRTGHLSSAPIRQLYDELTCTETGLSSPEAGRRLGQQRGLAKHETRLQRELRLLFRQFFNPLVFLLVVAVVLSALLGASSDTYIILFILLISGLLGFWQEANAGRAFDQLKKIIATRHNVLRDGKAISVDTAGIVTGDIFSCFYLSTLLQLNGSNVGFSSGSDVDTNLAVCFSVCLKWHGCLD
ncbi:cation-transporting P-type ATPase [Chitinophaga agri]|uniref:Cation-transporting P-type ATPase N-terminal domain-containing protein n=1 Tax=Chitinophaga agri TaxID=2703787 RepID=A0A6B9ZCQ2_9BACT|nr:cation-transporting P-type ATPase [Chitinophaga agri]QHS58895.1 hypothetical protein GWR21_04555 [Chitinophaga agri]